LEEVLKVLDGLFVFLRFLLHPWVSLDMLLLDVLAEILNYLILRVHWFWLFLREELFTLSVL